MIYANQTSGWSSECMDRRIRSRIHASRRPLIPKIDINSFDGELISFFFFWKRVKWLIKRPNRNVIYRSRDPADPIKNVIYLAA
jgi:hypothetical protein